MGARFGRNKRRAAREALSAAQEAATMANGLSEHLGKRLRALQQEIDDAKRVLARGSIAFPPEHIYIGGAPQRRLQVPEMQRLDYADFSSVSSTALMMRTIPLDVLAARVMDKDAEFGRAVHFMAEFAGRRVGYSASKEAIHYMPDDLLEREISRQMARLLVKDLKALHVR